MRETWRLIGISSNDAYMNMAIDEAIMRAKAAGRVPNTIRFYRWRPSAVSIGFFQSVEEEVDIGACAELGVDIVRRPTGGGAVYHDSDGELTYSLVVDAGNPRVSADFLTSYRALCEGIVRGLRSLGLDAHFNPVNDVLVGGRKISGNAQTRRLGTVLQHGTVLLRADLSRMFRVLRIADEKLRDKMISAAQERVTTIERELGRAVGFEEVSDALRRGFEEALGIELEEGDLSEEERSLAMELRGKYSSREWIYMR
ncbi:MAG: biotin/lipoate A/B protein ligase family protein [Candidatus Bathyarchaeia archaeon]